MKKFVTLTVTCLAMMIAMSLQTPEVVQQIPEPTHEDTLLNVKGQTALFIGDSHTANFKNGWQRRLSDSVGFVCKNAAVSGKTTYFMLDVAVYKLQKGIDWCFVYGGANDMYTHSITPQEAVDNIQAIARMCNHRGIRCVVLTGFDPIKCTRTDNPYYATKYAAFQKILLTQGIEGATVVDTRVVPRQDCWDALCHMSPSGHAKIARKVIQDLRLKTL
jgi:lysophospholipase L1-like esterase